MAEEKTENNNQHTPNPNVVLQPETDGISTANVDSPNNPQSEVSDSKKETSEKNNLPVFKKAKSDNWKRADVIAFWGVFVNAILALITISAVKIALDANNSSDNNFAKALAEGKKSADASIKSANAAENTLNVTKEAIKSSNENFIKSLEQYSKVADAAKKSSDISEKQFELTKTYSRRADSNYVKSLNIATTTLLTSQQSLIITQNNFTIQNRAYVFLNGVEIDSIKPYKPEVGRISVKNFGKTPALLLNSVINFTIDTTVFNSERRYPAENINYINIYIPENGEYSIPFKFIGMGDELFQSVINNKHFFIVYGEILFRDIATAKLYTYIFSFRILNNKRFAPTPNNNLVYEISSVDKWLNKVK